MRGGMFALAVCAASAGCSAPKNHHRGWVGGDFEEVAASGGLLEPSAPACSGGRVIGMPAGCPSRCGLLLVRAGSCSPLMQAGLRDGDLVTAIDGRPVGEPLDLRRAVEAHPPGSTLTLDVWREGGSFHAPVVVGKETYENWVSLGLFLLPSPHADLWPFDDGISVFGLVAAKSHPQRVNLETPERTYLAKVAPDCEPLSPRQESVDVRVFPIAIGSYRRVVRQETIAAAR